MAANHDRLHPSGQTISTDALFGDEHAFDEWVDQLELLRTLDQNYEFWWFLNDDMVGQTSLSSIVRGQAQIALLAGWVAESQSEQNTGSEFVVATLQFAFEELDLHRVEALVLLDNDPVNHLLSKLAFRDEGILSPLCGSTVSGGTTGVTCSTPNDGGNGVASCSVLERRRPDKL